VGDLFQFFKFVLPLTRTVSRFRALAYPVPLRDCNALINLSHETQEDEELRAQLEALSRTTSELRDKLDIVEKRIDELVYAGK